MPSSNRTIVHFSYEAPALSHTCPLPSQGLFSILFLPFPSFRRHSLLLLLSLPPFLLSPLLLRFPPLSPTISPLSPRPSLPLSLCPPRPLPPLAAQSPRSASDWRKLTSIRTQCPRPRCGQRSAGRRQEGRGGSGGRYRPGGPGLGPRSGSGSQGHGRDGGL